MVPMNDCRASPMPCFVEGIITAFIDGLSRPDSSKPHSATSAAFVLLFS